MADKSFGLKKLNLIDDSGNQTIESTGSISLNSPTVAISTDVTIGGQVQSNLKIGSSYSVGIGTTILNEKLNVSGNAYVSGIISAIGFVGSGTSLTGIIKNQTVGINSDNYQYFVITEQSSGSISSISVTPNLLVINPASKSLGIGTNVPLATLDVCGTGNFIGTVTAPSFSGTATTATNLANAANITTGIVSTSRLSGSYTINITGTATTASGLTTSINVNTSGIITAS
ncbi:hypothetical protein EBU95_16430, partial [bacterium]|nr:hypothetical protein [bacterium]